MFQCTQILFPDSNLQVSNNFVILYRDWENILDVLAEDPTQECNLFTLAAVASIILILPSVLSIGRDRLEGRTLT